MDDAFSAWRRFLESCAVAGVVSYYFDLPHTPELEPAPDTVAKIREAFPSTSRRFPVPRDRIDEALDLMRVLEPLPTNRWGMAPVWLRAEASFALKTPSGDVWPDQDPTAFGGFETPSGVCLGTSRTNLSIQAKRTMALLLSVPEATDDDLARLVPWLQEHLPFRLSAKHWSRWTLTKNGRTYRGRRLAM